MNELYLLWIDFMHKGGPVMWLIAGLALSLWTLVFERAWYLLRGFREDIRQSMGAWQRYKDCSRGQQQSLRLWLSSDLQRRLEHRLVLIRTLILLCPLLGLLGTVSGMIVVFDVIAFTSMGDIKLMANGVSRATIPTMASMVVAISGIFAYGYLKKHADKQKQTISDYFNGVGNA
jgi:biopolymer transport protein ExbB